jgi:hypothetical protein
MNLQGAPSVSWLHDLFLSFGMMGCARTKKSEQNARVAISTATTKH